MPYQKISLFVVTLVVLVGLVVAGALYLNQDEGAMSEDLSYILEPVATGVYDGELPPLDHEIVFSASYPEESRAAVRGHVEETVSKLSLHPEDGNAWMELALWYHTANDYAAAERVWNFIIEVSPTNVTVLNNLGRLYHFDTPDFPKAEEYFLKALELNPDRPDAYIELFDLYRYSYKKDTTEAVDIMRRAAARFPDEAGFHAALGGYYRDRGQVTLARIEYEKAIQKARELNDLTLVGALNVELANLK